MAADSLGACLARLSRLPLYLVLFLIVGYVFPLDVRVALPTLRIFHDFELFLSLSRQ